MPSTLTHSICLLPRGRISLFSGQWLHIGVHEKQCLPNQFNNGTSSHYNKELSFGKHVLSTYCVQGNPVRKWSEGGEWYTKMCSSQFRKTLWGKPHEENIQNWQIKITRCGKSLFCLAFIAVTLIKLNSFTIYMATFGISACETKGDYGYQLFRKRSDHQWSPCGVINS